MPAIDVLVMGPPILPPLLLSLQTMDRATLEFAAVGPSQEEASCKSSQAYESLAEWRLLVWGEKQGRRGELVVSGVPGAVDHE